LTFQKAIKLSLSALAYADLRVRWGVARARAAGLQPNDEFRGLYISDDQVDALLGLEFGRTFGFQTPSSDPNWQQAIDAARRDALQPDTPICHIQQSFHLSAIEIDALLLALLPEFDRRYERLYAYLQDDVTQKRPTVDLILNLLTAEPAQKLRLRAFFNEASRLRRERLLLTFAQTGINEPPLLSNFVRPAPSVTSLLFGDAQLDPALAEMATLEQVDAPIAITGLPEQLFAMAAAQPFFALIGRKEAGQTTAARALAQRSNAPLLTFNLALAENQSVELTRLAVRDARLFGAVLLVNGWDATLDDGQPDKRLLDLLLAHSGCVIVTGEKLWQATGERGSVAHATVTDRPIFTLQLDVPDFQTRYALWQHHLGDDVVSAQVANHFRFLPDQIAAAASTARDLARWENRSLHEDHLAAASRLHSNQKLGELATKIIPRYSWDDIVLPPEPLAMLHELVNTVEQRPQVYEEWGFGRKMSLGRGSNALFAGESGTGKTMAADIIAHELGLDLYKIDLSSVVSKYIGETEKNLGKIFQEAETSNAVLFFDEADALFGKRSEVKDSHDRYANIEVGYLLQRMETFDGVVILATNLRANLDDAFIRRLHFIIEFPFPEPDDRLRIWRVNLPPKTPLADDVDFELLAHRFRLSGGTIRNVLLAAAFLAARAGQPLAMGHLLHAIRRDYQKNGRLLQEQLFTM
jgi:AAA+ superfamily predicted ATPase